MVDFGPPTDPDQAGIRPAVIVQDDSLSQVFATVIVVPLTTKMKRLEFPASVFLDAGEGGLPQASVALCHQVMVRGKSRLTQHLGTHTPERLGQILDGILTAIGL